MLRTSLSQAALAAKQAELAKVEAKLADLDTQLTAAQVWTSGKCDKRGLSLILLIPYINLLVSTHT